METAKSPGWILTPWGSRIVVILLTIVAYLPALGGDFIDGDDLRFIVDNEPVRELSVGHAVDYFFVPSTVAVHTWEGIYRPLRTLDFAIDWAVSGGKAWFFHLRNILYHVLASLLALALFLRLAGDAAGQSRKAALLGALLFSLHPVQVESVAWITSRSDVLLLVLFLSATLLYLKGKYWGAGVAFVVALLAKESAVVFPAVVLALDLIRREKIRWVPIACFAGVSAIYCLAWFILQPQPGHLDTWWGGSQLATAQMLLRGTVFYARAILVPVRYVYDYHVPATPTLDAGTILGFAILAGAGIAFWRGGIRIRIAIAWFVLAIAPTSNLFVTVGIPTAERFVYLPVVGLAYAAGHLFARWRWSYILPLILCLGVLTFARCQKWRTIDTLFHSALKGEATPRGYEYLLNRSLARLKSAEREREAGNDDHALRMRIRREAASRLETIDDALRLFKEQLRVSETGMVRSLLCQKASALLILGRVQEAYDAARKSADGTGGARACYYAGVAAQRLAAEREKAARPGADAKAEIGDRLRGAEFYEEAGELLSSAYNLGYSETDLRSRIAENYRQAADSYLYVLDREVDPEQKGRHHGAAALSLFKAANIHIDLYGTVDDPELLLTAIDLHKAAGENFESSAKQLEDQTTSENLAELQKMAGASFHQAGMVQEALGGRRDAILSYLRSGENYELAVRDLEKAGAPRPVDLLNAAANSLFSAARLMETRGELKEAERFYRLSLQKSPNPRTQQALMRVLRVRK